MFFKLRIKREQLNNRLILTKELMMVSIIDIDNKEQIIPQIRVTKIGSLPLSDDILIIPLFELLNHRCIIYFM